jgi:regulation of enolase protein 1 (concanavalin A-like superfamily)
MGGHSRPLARASLRRGAPARAKPRRPRLAVLLAATLIGVLGTANAASAAGAPRSDEFNGGSLDAALWRVFDPVGDAQVSVSGGRARIALPAGSTHDLWTGALHAPRLLQAITDDDFEVELKFDSLLDARYQMQGLVVQQDADDLLRFEVHHDGGGLNLFAASIDGGQASVQIYTGIPGAAGPLHLPVYLRVKRVGPTWSLHYSFDGIGWANGGSFQHGLTVTEFGPFAGNSGGPAPATTVLVDHFRVLSDAPPPPDTTPPVISAVAATASAASATVTWTTNEAATSTVDYGTTTSYGATASSPGSGTSHSVGLSGLSCATTYHFRVRSADAAGNGASSPDSTFTTAACPGAPVSDELDGSALNQQLWRVVDPIGDAGVSLNGGQLLLDLPEGVSHDLWSGALHAPRLLQAVGNGDFEIEAKFDRAVSQAIQMQGLVAQQDHDDLVRFDVYSNGSETYLFAATFAGGAPTVRLHQQIAGGAPLLLRIRRTGSTWTLRYSRSGLTWTNAATFAQTMPVSEVGFFAGNHGSPASSSPVFSATIDHFHNAETAPPPPPDTTPPVISSVAAVGDVRTAVVTWSTNETATGDVAFGTTAGYGRLATSSGVGVTHRVTLAGLACETVYHFSAQSSDESGNRAVAADATFTTATCPLPIQSDEFDAPPLNQRWQSRDPIGDSTITAGQGNVSISLPAGSRHDLWTDANHAPRLLQSTRDEDFEVQLRFETAVAEQYEMQGVVVEQDERNLLRFEAHYDGARTVLFAAAMTDGRMLTKHSSVVASGSPVHLRVKRAGATWTLRHSSDGTFWSAPVSFTQSMTVTALGPFVGNNGTPPPAFTGRIDYFRVLSVGTPPPDTTPPVVGNVTTTSDDESAVIAWVTDEPASSSVRYGLSTSYGATVSSSELVTNHQAALADLACGSTYHFQIVVRDEVGNERTTGDQTFSTAVCPPPDLTPPTISSVSVQPNVRSAYITWTTDERATSTVEYGANASYGSTTTDATLVTTHRLHLSELSCGASYHFRVSSRDRAGNTASSPDGVFQTTACPPPGGPEIDIWYGDEHVFGTIGTPQNWGNVMGHASDPDGLAYVDYSLNGGPLQTLAIHPEGNVRIGAYGDFNVELDLAQLLPGPNHVEIVATDRVGYQTRRTVTVRYDGGAQWPFPYTTNWSGAARISDVAQVVDGLWGIEGADVRTLLPAYDRVIAFGERTWTNYEVSAPFTINQLTTDSWHQGFGVGVGWQGHAGTERPRIEYPLGMICFYYRRNPFESYHLWLLASETPFDITHDGRDDYLTPGVRYVMKMRTQNIGNGTARYSCKVWRAGTAEPSGWDVTSDWPARAGSVIIVADYADVSFGAVTARPIAG